ncbi:hypothetical protein [Frondihabitans sucicola]|nr:hypothetical protein [Frondihabitans sucicola]
MSVFFGFGLAASRMSIAAVTAVVASLVVGAPATAAESPSAGAITVERKEVLRSNMGEAGISSSVADHLMTKIEAGEELDSQKASAVPISQVEETSAGELTRTVERFADGSTRSTELVPLNDGHSPTIDDVSTYATVRCNLVHCTLYMTRAQTKQMATGPATAAAVIAAACGPAAWACAIATGILVDQSKKAKSQNKCLGLRKFVGPSLVSWPVIESCLA